MTKDPLLVIGAVSRILRCAQDDTRRKNPGMHLVGVKFARRLHPAGVMALVVGVMLAQWSSVTAQTPPADPPSPVRIATPSPDATFFSASGFRVALPAFWNYFQSRGGVREFGYPISNDFPLLGKRVQLFQRQVLQLEPDGSVSRLNLLDPNVLPIAQIDGLHLPAADPTLIAAGPANDDPDYPGRVLDLLNQTVPNDWKGLPVGFAQAYFASVTCDDAFPNADCDPSLLAGFAMELWGLPTSKPAQDPTNLDFVYQRFQRGVLHYSAAAGQTQWLLLGDWFKRVLLGIDLPADVRPQVDQSRFYAQYSPGRPLGLARPAELPDTSFASAFLPATELASAQAQPGLVPVLLTATAVSATATAASLTQTPISSPTPTTTVFGATQTAIAVAPTQTVTGLTALGTSTPVVLSGVPPSGVTAGSPIPSGTPATTLGCLRDEQMWFVPRKPAIGTRVLVSVSSQRRHDVRVMQLGALIDTGAPTERVGSNGWVWTWTVVPQVVAFYEFTFFADGLRPCITSGFNAVVPIGSTATPTPTKEPSATPGPTGTVTPTPPPAPAVTSISPTSGGCGTAITIVGTGFGSPAAGQTVPLGGQVFFGGRAATIASWAPTSILVFPPSGATTSSYTLVVSVAGGGSSTAPQAFALTTPTSASC